MVGMTVITIMKHWRWISRCQKANPECKRQLKRKNHYSEGQRCKLAPIVEDTLEDCLHKHHHLQQLLEYLYGSFSQIVAGLEQNSNSIQQALSFSIKLEHGQPEHAHKQRCLNLPFIITYCHQLLEEVKWVRQLH